MRNGNAYSGFFAAVLGFALPLMVWGACSTSVCRPDGKQASGAVYRICLPEPSCYSGDLVVFAHGYVDASSPIQIPEDQLNLGDGTSLPGLVNSLGYGFATTSYSRNGLSILEGVADVRDLVDVYSQVVGPPAHVYMTGASEGGLVTTKALESFPGVFTAGLAACGPVGDFRLQVNYLGDARVLFDYFFPGVLPGSATDIPDSLKENWYSRYEPAVRAAISADPVKTEYLLRTGNIATALDPANAADAIVAAIGYNVFATEDAAHKLGGQPFDNISRWYFGSNDDEALNAKVLRVAADPAAISALEAYQTNGQLSAPLVTLHTRSDPLVPYWHEFRYLRKLLRTGDDSLRVNVPIFRFGHCRFAGPEVLASFLLMLLKASGQDVTQAQEVLPAGALRDEFERLVEATRR